MNGNLVVQPHRIVLANESRLWREMLKRVIEKIPDLRIVGVVTDLAILASVVEQTSAGWVILSLTRDGKIPEMAESLLSVHPSVRILAVATDGSQVKMKWLEPHEDELDDWSLNEMIDVLRGSTPSPTTELINFHAQKAGAR